MRKLLRIIEVEKRTNKEGKTYFRTHAILDNMEIAVGYGVDFKVGDLLEAWFDDRWDCYKMRKSKPKTSQ